MSPEISERSFEAAIERALLQYGPDACAGEAKAVRETPPPYGHTPPGGYRKRKPEDYDRTLCLLPRDVLDFVLATQPQEWKKLEQHHGAAVREQFVRRLANERLSGEGRSTCCATASRIRAASSDSPTSDPRADLITRLDACTRPTSSP